MPTLRWLAGEEATDHDVYFGDDATVSQWTEWKIPLSGFTGVNVARIKSMIIGLGDRSSPKKGGAGLLFIDDIRITKP